MSRWEVGLKAKKLALTWLVCRVQNMETVILIYRETVLPPKSAGMLPTYAKELALMLYPKHYIATKQQWYDNIVGHDSLHLTHANNQQLLRQ